MLHLGYSDDHNPNFGWLCEWLSSLGKILMRHFRLNLLSTSMVFVVFDQRLIRFAHDC